MLNALAGTGVEVMVGVTNGEALRIGESPSTAGLHQCHLTAVVPRIDAGTILEQQRINFVMAFGGSKMERGIKATEGAVLGEA
uniref:Uncharacterized protein n=1 Tax=Nelumbo nucifera TaxID=4432 RepID=A0A822XTC1_NELNU|nr:TPA_asm: hypothetical protein HUJ06_023528 [Nelumbo nucifera]